MDRFLSPVLTSAKREIIIREARPRVRTARLPTSHAKAIPSSAIPAVCFALGSKSRPNPVAVRARNRPALCLQFRLMTGLPTIWPSGCREVFVLAGAPPKNAIRPCIQRKIKSGCGGWPAQAPLGPRIQRKLKSRVPRSSLFLARAGQSRRWVSIVTDNFLHSTILLVCLAD